MERGETPVLEVCGLAKNFGKKNAVQQVSFNVRPGEILGVLGPNGAGKTTTVSMVVGVLTPSGGSIRISGIDLARNRAAALARANVSALYSQLPGNMSVYENLRVFSFFYGVREAKRRIHEALEAFEIERHLHTKYGLLSSGEQTRVNLAKAMLNDPDLLVLDEPTASLDPVAARFVRMKIRSVFSRRGRGVLWTSHNMQEVTDICDRVVFLSHGKVVAEGDPRKLPAQHGKLDLEDLYISLDAQQSVGKVREDEGEVI